MDKLHEMLREKNDEAYLALRLADAEKQPQLMAVFVVLHEAYEAYTASSDAMLGKIKIAWWRERIEEIMAGNTPRPHPALLALGADFKHYAELLKILAEFEKMLGDWQAKSFSEIEGFIANSFGEAFEICGEIAGGFEYARQLGVAYGSLYLLRKFRLNNNMFKGSEELTQTIEESFLRNIEAMPESAKKTGFGVIIEHYKNAEPKARWRLLLKMFFSAHEAI